ncbi:OmpA family protein [Muriicola jejuensis]|uniref:OmpA family protein n=2 Tax=Muriicola jejuensis TaxID=504488 RepID=A0A6P0UEB6_9FLAO|nr:OmpA family protein [Muriicola jejuensis]
MLGCNTVKNANNTQKGAVIGATGGAVIGGVIGNNVGKGNTVLGAIIGGVVGGAAGGYIGNRMDRQAERIQEEIPGAEVTRVGEGINVTFSQGAGVYFDTNKSDIKGTSVETLDKLAGIFKEYPKTVILVEGHTDSAGSDEYNMGLSKLRAESVTNYLVRQGIDASRFTTKWYGETQPIADNATAEGKAKNRRVELGIIASEELKQEAIQKTKG